MKAGLIFLLAFAGLRASTVREIDLGVAPNITHAKLFMLREASDSEALVIFVAGFGVDGRGIGNDETWLRRCVERRWALCTVNFESPVGAVAEDQGFVDTTAGSGRMLDVGLARAGYGEMPLLMIGYSAGARFVWSFVNTGLRNVRAWCLYAGSSFPSFPAIPPSPGIIACGTHDSRCGTMYTMHQTLRDRGARTAWVPLDNFEHKRPVPLEPFALDFFLACLNRRINAEALWASTQTKAPATDQADVDALPRLYSWIPNAQLLPAWAELNANW